MKIKKKIRPKLVKILISKPGTKFQLLVVGCYSYSSGGFFLGVDQYLNINLAIRVMIVKIMAIF